MKRYNTTPRKRLLSFLKAHYDRQFTVEEIAEKVTGISISTIYRNVGKMVEEGSVQRFSIDGSRKFLYQYFDEDNCSRHLHLKCVSCGFIFHVEENLMSAILASAVKNEFRIDRKKTILYGSCKHCS